LRGSYQCSCFPGYKMKKNGRCKPINYCRSKPCEQRCISVGTTYKCECFEGYRLSSDGKHCEDIDECSHPDRENCSDTCIYYQGGYNCSCQYSGYVLRQDKKSCFRMSYMYIQLCCQLTCLFTLL
jgi:fibulin 1/2